MRFLWVISILLLFSCGQDGHTKKELQVEKTEVEDFILPPVPDTVYFCGEEIVMSSFDLKERLDKELIVNTFYHSSTIQGFKRANRYFDEISGVLKDEGVPDDFKYLCLIESGLTQAKSPAGALGFWQFMPTTAKEYGLTISSEVDERMDVKKSTRAACAYLKDAYHVFGDWTLTAAAYNRGVSGIAKQMEEQGVESYFDLYLNNETSRYVFRILALKLIFENPEAYGFEPEKMELYEPVSYRTIKLNQPVLNLRKWAVDNGSNYKMVKLLNPWILGNKLTSGNYSIRLPKE